MKIFKRVLWGFGPLALIALMGVTTSGFPTNPRFNSVANTGLITTGTVLATGSLTGPSCSNGTATSTAVICAQSQSSANYSGMFGGSTTTGQSFGILVTAGTNSTDTALQIGTAANTTLVRFRGDGGITGFLGQTAVGTFTQVANAACTVSNPARGMTCATDVSGTSTTITFSPAFATAPTCTLSNGNSTQTATITTGPLPTTTVAHVVTSAGAQTFYIICST